MIWFVCNPSILNYFSDYIESVRNSVENTRILDVSDATMLNSTDIYIFCQSIPAQIIAFRDRLNLVLLNTEQLPAKNIVGVNIEYIENLSNYNIPIIDYDKFQCSLTKSKLHMYLPYQWYSTEQDYLTSIVQQTPPQYDVAVCGEMSKRRHLIISELERRGISVLNVKGWNSIRDERIAQARILLNIHYADSYVIFEHLRCDRWALAGMIVVSEQSLSDDILDIKPLLILSSYDKLADTVSHVLGKYSDIYANHKSQLTNMLPNIKKSRLIECKNTIDQITAHYA